MTPMKCDKLESFYYYEDRVITPATHMYRVYHADNVDAAIAELKAKLESVQASAYADSVDAGMRERRLWRALYKACANWASSASCFLDGYAASLVEYKPAKSDELATKSRRFEMMEIKCRDKAEEYR